MKVTLLNIKMPTRVDYGTIQINNFSNTYFRFEIKDGKPVLDTSFFADQIENPDEKYKVLKKDSDLYIAVQQLLNEYFE